jgi:hypothetical protein
MVRVYACTVRGSVVTTLRSDTAMKVVTYSVLDGLRLLVAHDRRHFEQARRVMQSPDFAAEARRTRARDTET